MKTNGSHKKKASPKRFSSYDHRMWKSLAFFKVVVLFLVIGGGLALYWQRQDLMAAQKHNDQLGVQLAQARQVDLPTASNSADHQLIAGEVDLNQEATDMAPDMMYVTGYVKTAKNLKALWVEYGTDSNKLHSQTEHLTKEISTGYGPDAYGRFSFSIRKAALSPGATYFYRLAATDGSSTIYSQIAAFTSLK